MMKNIKNKQAIKELFDQFRVKDIMTSHVSIVDIDADMSDVQDLFVKKRSSHVCVVDEDKKLVGIISRKYFYKMRSPHKMLPGETYDQDDADIMIDGDSIYDKQTLDGYILSEVMQKLPPSLKSDDALSLAIKKMKRLQVDCIPIIDNRGLICGILK